MGRCTQALQCGEADAIGHRPPRHIHRFGIAPVIATHVDGGRGVQQYGRLRPHGAAATQHVFDQGGVVRGIAPNQVVQRNPRQAMRGGVNRPRRRAARSHFYHMGRAEGRDFVQPRLPVHDHRPDRSQRGQGSGEQFETGVLGDAHHLPPRARRVGERTDNVHHRRHGKFTTHGAHVAQRRMHERREHEHDARVSQRGRHGRRRGVDDHSQRLEHVGTPRARRERPVAVLRDAHTHAGGHQRRRRRDVERGQRSPAGPARVDQFLGTFGRQHDHRFAQRLDHPGHLGGRFAFDPKRHEERSHLHRRAFPAHDDSERASHAVRIERRMGGQPTNRLAQRLSGH